MGKEEINSEKLNNKTLLEKISRNNEVDIKSFEKSEKDPSPVFDEFGRLRNDNYKADTKGRGVSLEVDPETGELVAIADENVGEILSQRRAERFEITREHEKQPRKYVDLSLGEEQYVDDSLQKIKELRAKLKSENNDPLEVKQIMMQRGLEEIGLSKEDLGKTGDSRSGEVTDKHKKIAASQVEDAMYHRQLQREKKSR